LILLPVGKLSDNYRKNSTNSICILHTLKHRAVTNFANWESKWKVDSGHAANSFISPGSCDDDYDSESKLGEFEKL